MRALPILPIFALAAIASPLSLLSPFSVGLVSAAPASNAPAAPSPSSDATPSPSASPPPSPSSSAAPDDARETEFLVPPGGGAFEVPVKLGEVCILTFPGEVAHSAVRSVATFNVNPWNQDSLAVRALPGATSATLAVATKSGALKINVTLRVAAPGEPTLALVTFRAVTAEQAYEARVAAEVAKRVAPLATRLDAERAQLERSIQEQSARMLAERAMKRSAAGKLRAIGQAKDQPVIARVTRALALGDDAYVSFTIDNRTKAPFRVARVEMTEPKSGAIVGVAARLVEDKPAAKAPGKADAKAAVPEGKPGTPTGPARAVAERDAVTAPAASADTKTESGTDKPNTEPLMLRAISAQAAASGVVVVRDANKWRGKAFSLTVIDEQGRSAIVVDKGIILP